jgi:cell division protein WhiA
MAQERSFTEAVRQELARRELGTDAAVHAELAGLLRVAGSMRVHGGQDQDDRVALELRTTSGAVARRVFALLQRRYGLRPELLVRSPGGLHQRSTYAVRIQHGGADVGRDLGLLDDRGRPAGPLPTGLRGPRAVAYLRGAFLASGSLSAPGRAPHLEIGMRSSELAEAVAELARGLVTGTVSAAGGTRPRVVVKSGATIGELLTTMGATGAFLAWDERRLRRQLRSDATRLANADAANLRRTIEAAATQVRTVETVVAEVGWERLEEPLRAVALARLANPEASLSELGELIDPPVAKSVVHRRLKRLEELADRHA